MSMPEFCPGYVDEPYRTLAANYPDETAYPQSDFRTEWGPVFHRGRLDGSARVLLVGQDPGQHENVLRRILSGEAGRRVQGFLTKIGINRSYVLVNALLYSVYGANGSKYVAKPKVTTYRNQWLNAILAPGSVQAVVTFGGMAEKAWKEYLKTNTAPAGVQVHHLTHPTFPESAGGTAAIRATNTKKMLTQWNGALQSLFGAVQVDVAVPAFVPYGAGFKDAEKGDIPAFDLPAGTPAWMYDNDGWAKRQGSSAAAKRANITITVPKAELP
jgi:uracil-DNA glycosylase